VEGSSKTSVSVHVYRELDVVHCVDHMVRFLTFQLVFHGNEYPVTILLGTFVHQVFVVPPDNLSSGHMASFVTFQLVFRGILEILPVAFEYRAFERLDNFAYDSTATVLIFQLESRGILDLAILDVAFVHSVLDKAASVHMVRVPTVQLAIHGIHALFRQCPHHMDSVAVVLEDTFARIVWDVIPGEVEPIRMAFGVTVQ